MLVSIAQRSCIPNRVSRVSRCIVEKRTIQVRYLGDISPPGATHFQSNTTLNDIDYTVDEKDILAGIDPKVVDQTTLVDRHLNLELNKPRGVFREKEVDDIKVLVNNFTAPALAEALRDRESTLQQAAGLLFKDDIEQLRQLLNPFLDENVAKRRLRKHELDLSQGFTRKEIVILQRYIHRMPRNVFQAAQRRASVVIPLCNVGGVASILFERRSMKVRTHKQQVCFPGGMLDEGVDSTIIQTSLREMEEELGIAREKIEVLGILRCNWNEVASMTGISVTPVIGFIGELNNLVLTPNSDEVEQYFTVSLEELLDEQKWLTRNFSTPVFTGGPHTIWGLTAYLLDKFLKDVVLKCSKAPVP